VTGLLDTREETGSRKAYRDGTHRAVTPEITLARVEPLLPRIGVTRVAMLTGLDTIGIPVAAAYRPNSRSISVHQGKGASPAAAKASAIMEALETHHAESVDLPLRLGTYENMRKRVPSVDPGALPRARGGSPLDGPILWTPGVELLSGAVVWVPFALVGFDLVADDLPGATAFQRTTNGLASGNNWHEAAIHALCEVVERDAVTLWSAAGPATQDACAVDPVTIDSRCVAGLLAKFAAAAMVVKIWDVTSDIGLPAFVALVTAADRTCAEIGAGCHLDREVALSRALTEAAQARLTVISGAREDLEEGVYCDRASERRVASINGWLGARARRSWNASPNCATGTLTEDLAIAVDRLRAAGLNQVVAVDLTKVEFGVPVLRVIVPGLEGPWTGHDGDYVPGERARRNHPAR
jgi:ribosomal protein S12 methylthiotransferase accessory factor